MDIRIVAGPRTLTNRMALQGLRRAKKIWDAKKRKPDMSPGSRLWKKYLGHFGPPVRKKKSVAKKQAASKRKPVVKKTAKKAVKRSAKTAR
jgi:hypothetical protein